MDKIGVGYADITELEKRYVMEALESSRLSQGRFVLEFERKFSRMHNQKYGVMCNSGTSAIHVALEVLKEVFNWEKEAEILVPAITFISTSNACLHAGLKPVFVDVDPSTYNINPSEIEKHINKKTKAIIAVHAFGLPCEMDAIVNIAQQHNLLLIEDCAEAHFAKYKGKPVGSFGEIACFSTYVAHTVTSGIGGVITTNNREYSEISRSLIAHGRSCCCEVCEAASSNSVCPKRLNSDMDKRFTFTRLGYSYRVGELEGALGLAQIQRAEENITHRRKNAQLLTELLSTFENILILPKYPDYVEHTFMMYPILIKDNTRFDRIHMTSYLEKHNIETRPMLPLLNQPVYKNLFGDIESRYPVAMNINKNGFYIGNHLGMHDEHIKYIAEVFGNFINTSR